MQTTLKTIATVFSKKLGANATPPEYVIMRARGAITIQHEEVYASI